MLTLFALPKPFVGHINIIQRNAIRSWMLLQPQCEIILFGDEEGTADCAKEFNVHHIPVIAKNEFNTPLVSDLFNKARLASDNNILCYVNSDVIFFAEILSAVTQIRHLKNSFLIIGQCWHLDIKEIIDFGNINWEKTLKKRIANEGELREFWAMDFFIFTRDLYKEIPPFALGRAYFDNWLIWKAIKSKASVIDVTKVVKVIHQRHDYFHVKGGQSWAHHGDEAKNNVNLAGGLSRRYCMLDSTHLFSEEGLKRNLINKVSWEMIKILKDRIYYSILDKTRSFRHKIGLFKKK